MTRHVLRIAAVASAMACLAGHVFAIPVLTVLPPIDISGNLQWTVQVAADPGLFTGAGSALAVELGFTTDSSFVSATKNAADWTYDTPGNNPFTNSITLGVQQTASDVFASLGSTNILTTADPLTVLTIVTAGTAPTTLNWGGQTLLSGTPDEYIGARIAQSELNYDGYMGSLSSNPGGVVDGDFNNDDLWDCTDIDALVAEVVAGTNNPDFDMNGDGVVTAADVTDAGDGWLAVGGANNVSATGGNAFLRADGNLDGSVDVPDFNIWNGNKFTTNPGWCSGDYNVDGVVDVPDFNLWNGNKFSSSSVTAVVPEPATWSLVCLGLLSLLIRRR